MKKKKNMYTFTKHTHTHTQARMHTNLLLLLVMSAMERNENAPLQWSQFENPVLLSKIKHFSNLIWGLLLITRPEHKITHVSDHVYTHSSSILPSPR